MPTKQRKAMLYKAVNGTLNALDDMKKEEWRVERVEERWEREKKSTE